MRRHVRENAISVLLAGLGIWILVRLGLTGLPHDYFFEVRPAFAALMRGHPGEFLQLAPAYGGSLVERAPFVLPVSLWGGGALAVYRAAALPCLLAAAVLGIWLAAQMRPRTLASTGSQRAPSPTAAAPGAAAVRSQLWARGWVARAVVVTLCVANPLTLAALEYGHPEEVLGAVLCVAAVLLAARGHSVWAGIALGLAIANKEWALVAIGPTLIALPGTYGTRRGAGLRAARAAARGALVCACSAGVVAAGVLAPLALVPGGGFVTAARAVAATPSRIFLPWSVWWFLGSHESAAKHKSALNHVQHVHKPVAWVAATAPGYRAPPAWVGPISHPSIVVAGAVLAVLLWWARRRDRAADSAAAPVSRRRDALLLLALVMLLRCLLDTWDFFYYMLPFALAVLAWESLERPTRPPILAFAVPALAWAGFTWVHGTVSPDLESALFDAWTLPLAAGMALLLYAPARATAIADAIRRPRWLSGGSAPRAERPGPIVEGPAAPTF